MPDKVIRKDCIKQYKPGCSPFKAVVLDRRLFGNVWVLVSCHTWEEALVSSVIC